MFEENLQRYLPPAPQISSLTYKHRFGNEEREGSWGSKVSGLHNGTFNKPAS